MADYDVSSLMYTIWQTPDMILEHVPFDPIYIFFFTKFIFWYGLAYTSPNSIQRPIIWILIAITCVLTLRSPNIFFMPGATACDWVMGVFFHSSNFLLIAKRSPPAGMSRERWAFREIFAGRWATKHFPAFDEKNKNWVPSRTRLFITRAIDFAICFTIAKTFEQYNLPWENYADPGSFFNRLNEVTQHELFVRSFLALKGLGIPYLGLRAGHSFCTCVALIFGADPKEWPPLYGSITTAYTVRRFYSHFWHHAMRSALTSHGALLTYLIFQGYSNLLRTIHRPVHVSKLLRSPSARLLTTVFSFLMSAIMHILTCPRLEVYMTVPELWMHLGTAGAIVLEDLFIRAWKAGARAVGFGRQSNRLVVRDGKDSVERVETNASSSITTAHAATEKSGAKNRKTDKTSISEKVEEKATTKPKIKPSKVDLFYRGVGYIWTFSFFTWATSGLMFALYNS